MGFVWDVVGAVVGFEVGLVVGLVVGSVGIVVGTVGSVVGIVGNVVGIVGNVVGIVGSVVGIVGNVVGIVGSVVGIVGKAVGIVGSVVIDGNLVLVEIPGITEELLAVGKNCVKVPEDVLLWVGHIVPEPRVSDISICGQATSISITASKQADATIRFIYSIPLYRMDILYHNSTKLQDFYKPVHNFFCKKRTFLL